MTKKKYDLAVKVGEKPDGKAIWKNCGVVLEKEDGGRFILLERTFNPAGVPGSEPSILISMFAPKPKDDQAPAPHDGDDIPF